MAHNVPGRHRAPGRFNPLAELRLIAKESAQPAVKCAAIVAASGGLVATTFASPANAADSSHAVVAAQSQQGIALAAASGPAKGAVQVGTALKTIGFTTTPAVHRAVAKAKPRVIEDIVVKNARAAAAQKQAKAKAAAEKRAASLAAQREAAAQRAAAQRAAAQQAAERTTRTTTSRSTTRTAIAATPSKATTTKKVNTAAPTQSASGIVGIAQRAFGVPYRYGGSSMGGFDCSGLTSWVYRQAGISIPRTASAQQSAATRVSSPRAGDLVFFGSPAYHVGIYVSPGRMIDAQRTGTVVGNHSIWTTPSGYGRF